MKPTKPQRAYLGILARAVTTYGRPVRECEITGFDRFQIRTRLACLAASRAWATVDRRTPGNKGGNPADYLYDITATGRAVIGAEPAAVAQAEPVGDVAQVDAEPAPRTDTRPRVDMYRGRRLRVAQGKSWGTIAVSVNGKPWLNVGGSGADAMNTVLAQVRRDIDAADARRITEPDAYPAYWYVGAPEPTPAEIAQAHAAAWREVADRAVIGSADDAQADAVGRFAVGARVVLAPGAVTVATAVTVMVWAVTGGADHWLRLSADGMPDVYAHPVSLAYAPGAEPAPELGDVAQAEPVASGPAVLTCVKPVGGFNRTDGPMDMCGDPARFLLSHSPAVRMVTPWCGPHAADAARRFGDRWVAVDSVKGAAMLARDAQARAEWEAGQAERDATTARRAAERAAGPIVHTFATTGEAYDASQTDDEICDGDVLHVPSEGVAGYLAAAWPIAVTAAHGEFHGIKEGSDHGPEYAASVARARALAAQADAERVDLGDVAAACAAAESLRDAGHRVTVRPVDVAQVDAEPVGDVAAEPHPLRPHRFTPKAPGSVYCVAPCHYADEMPIHRVAATPAQAEPVDAAPVAQAEPVAPRPRVTSLAALVAAMRPAGDVAQVNGGR